MFEKYKLKKARNLSTNMRDELNALLKSDEFDKFIKLSRTPEYFKLIKEYRMNFYNNYTSPDDFITALIENGEYELFFLIGKRYFSNLEHNETRFNVLDKILIDDITFAKRIFMDTDIISNITLKDYDKLHKRYGHNLPRHNMGYSNLDISNLTIKDIPLISDYFSIMYKKHIDKFDIHELYLLYSHVKYSVDITSYYITEKMFIDMINEYFNPGFSDFVLTIVNEDNKYQLMTHYFNYGTEFNKLLDKTGVIDTDKTEWFSLILDSLNCHSSNTVIKLLEKSKLPKERKEEILLLKAGKKSCNI